MFPLGITAHVKFEPKLISHTLYDLEKFLVLIDRNFFHQVLHLNDNELVHLPTSVDEMTSLTDLNLDGNPLKKPPQEVCVGGVIQPIGVFLRSDTARQGISSSGHAYLILPLELKEGRVFDCNIFQMLCKICSRDKLMVI